MSPENKDRNAFQKALQKGLTNRNSRLSTKKRGFFPDIVLNNGLKTKGTPKRRPSKKLNKKDRNPEEIWHGEENV